MLGLWRGPGAPGEGRGVTGKGPCSGVPEINDSHRARSCGAPHRAVGLVPASGAQPLPEAPPRGRPHPALAPSSPARSCPSSAPCATARTCTFPGWQLGGGTRSHSAGGCPGVGRGEDGDPRQKLEMPRPWVRALGRSRGTQPGACSPPRAGQCSTSTSACPCVKGEEAAGL